MDFGIIEIGGNAPIPEIADAHKRALATLEGKLSQDGARIIGGLYTSEAEIHGAVSSWAHYMDEYVKGLQGTHPLFSQTSTREMLHLVDAEPGVITDVIRDLGLYKETILNSLGKQ